MNKIKLMILCTGLHGLGGTARHLASWVKNIDREQFSLICFVHSRNEVQLQQYFNEQAGCHARDIQFIPREKWGFPFATIFMVARLMRKHHIDVLHTVFLQSDVIGSLARMITRTPVHISSVEGLLIPHVNNPFKRLLYRFSNTAVRSLINMTIVISHGLLSILERNGEVNPQRTTVIHSGVDAPMYGGHSALSGTQVKVGVLARFSQEKGILSFVRSIPLIRARHSSTEFIIAGDGPQREEIESEIHAAGGGGHVRMVGWQNDARKFLASIDILVVPSFEEGLPWVLLDAVACRVAVVATNVGGNPDVIRPAETGILIPPNSPAAIADAVGFLIDNPDVRKMYIQNAAQKQQDSFQASQEIMNIQELCTLLYTRASSMARTC